MSSVASRITKLEKELNALKVELNSSEKKKIKKIEDCTKKDQVEKFPVSELKEFIKKKKIDSKNASNKEDFVKIVLKFLKNLNKEESEDEYEDESEYEDEDDQWEYYYA